MLFQPDEEDEKSFWRGNVLRHLGRKSRLSHKIWLAAVDRGCALGKLPQKNFLKQ